MSKRSTDDIVKLLMSKSVVEFSEIKTVLDDASRATVFRYLSGIQYRCSYNYNGRYYTLHDPDRYDRFGLWSHGDIHFSRDGNLQSTVTRLVEESEAGYTQRELQELLRVRVQSLLIAGVRRQDIAREVVEKLYVYLHLRESVRKEQLENRRSRLETKCRRNAEVSDDVVIQVLLVLIRHPGSKANDVARRLRGHSPPIGLHQIELIFSQYGLGEKRGL